MSDKKPMGKVKRGLLVSAPLVVGMAIAVYVWGGNILKSESPKKSIVKIVKLENKAEENTSNTKTPSILSYGEKIVLENGGKKVEFNQIDEQEKENPFEDLSSMSPSKKAVNRYKYEDIFNIKKVDTKSFEGSKITSPLQDKEQESSSKQIVKKDNWTLDVKVSTKNKDGNPNDKQVNIGLDFNF